ncbi:DUF3558 family protein [Amycolatopsis anabasis]|uniref:DUF3558 family protein n=1 Tax=Amycolatopsis anabasis TaxID=1840409 RepID=UPI00131E6BF6|nr:hypothetical protein [Amycolatopsis anabasis]
MRRGILAAVAAALMVCLVCTGCASEIAGKALPEGAGGGQPEQRTPKPKDRDLQAVTVALRKLDACGVFDVELAKSRGATTATPLATGPHGCMLAPKPDYSPGDDGIEVQVGVSSDQSSRYRATPVTVGGAKAYESKDYGSSAKRCELVVPVSFTRGIEFKYQSYDDVDTCPVVRQYAEAAVAKLRNPDTITVDTAKRPFAAWDGCVFLTQVLGADANNYTYQPSGTKDEFSGCETRRKEGTGRPSYDPKLEVFYDQVLEKPEGPRQIGGKTVEVKQVGSCVLTWDQADSGTGNKWLATLKFKLTAADCEQGAKLAEQAMRLADQAPPDANAQPQRPLLFAPDENDTGAVGACADFGATGGQADCEPYHETKVPQGTEAIMSASDSDRNLWCAVYADAVKAHFGPELKALTWGEHCFFVEPTHTLSLRMNVDSENVPADYGDRPDLYVERQETQIAGKPAVTFYDKRKSTFDIYLSPWGDLGRRGNLHIGVEALPGRGDDSRNDAQLDPAKAQAGIQAMTDTVQRYFAS